MKKVLLTFLVLLLASLFVFAADKVEINTASLPQLEELTGVGPTIAQRIVDARPFSSVDDLLRVKGIGERTLQKIKDQGLAYVLGSDSAKSSGETTGAEPSAQVENSSPPVQEQNNVVSSAPKLEASPAPDTIIYPGGIVINEILPAPEGPDDTSEWIELYNANSFDVDMGGWKIKDSQGALTEYTFPKNITILGKGYLVLKRPATNITLNNDQDSLDLILPNGKIVSSASYQNAPKNQSYNGTASGWQWSSTLTPGAANKITQILPENKKSDKSNAGNLALAAAGPSIGDSAGSLLSAPLGKGMSDPWLLFLTAITLAIVSASAVLIINLKLKKKKVENQFEI